MNPIDQAIREHLLESRLYSTQSGDLCLRAFASRPVWIDAPFPCQWNVIQKSLLAHGLARIQHVRDRTFSLDPHKELHLFYLENFFADILSEELQLNSPM